MVFLYYKQEYLKILWGILKKQIKNIIFGTIRVLKSPAEDCSQVISTANQIAELIKGNDEG
eukprot:snap_masked-scaffold_81-processed-gene-0.43-mRNA-1 protein AED:1.00 eAED:1.00 QI:0/0/0/0/1/1/2/0/60